MCENVRQLFAQHPLLDPYRTYIYAYMYVGYEAKETCYRGTLDTCMYTFYTRIYTQIKRISTRINVYIRVQNVYIRA